MTAHLAPAASEIEIEDLYAQEVAFTTRRDVLNAQIDTLYNTFPHGPLELAHLGEIEAEERDVNRSCQEIHLHIGLLRETEASREKYLRRAGFLLPREVPAPPMEVA